jgi:AcrR family transcriptional regulator
MVEESKAGQIDPREERTGRQLTQAVLAMAAERDITHASVAELARQAGINRSTFYAHAATPVALLTRVLNAELDVVRQRTETDMANDGFLTRDIARQTLDQIIDHVEHRIDIYGGIDRPSSRYALRVVLAEHVEQSVLLMLREGFAVPPIAGTEFEAMFAGYLAHGVVGAVEAWLRLPSPRTHATLIDAVEQMYPAWYAPPAPRAPEIPHLSKLQRKDL